MPYREIVYQSLAEEKGRMWWGAFGHSQAGDEEEKINQEFTNRALRIARFDKAIVSIFNVAVAVAPFLAVVLGVAVFSVASSVMLSLVVTLGLTSLYAIQTLSSFVSAESSKLLSVLPIAQKDFSLISLLTFIRSVDYMVAGSIASQVIMVALLTRSFLATTLMLLVAVVNQVFAVTIALWFSTVFQRNLSYGGRSRTKSALRFLFILVWGLLLVSVGFMFILPWYTGVSMESLFLSFDNMRLLFLLLYPFSTAALVSGFSSAAATHTFLLLSSLSITVYAALAIVATRWSLKTIKNIIQSPPRILRCTVTDFSIKIRRPMLAYVFKDIKVASRNPATAFFFVLPVIETVTITLIISNQSMLRTSMLLDSTLMGAIFALLVPLALLTAEGKGLEFTKTLPVNSRKIILSKTLITIITYSFVPLALAILAVVKPLTSFSSILIPCLTVISVGSASILEIRLFMRTIAKNKISALANDFQKLALGVLIVLIPLLLYGIVFLLLFSYAFSLLAMAVAVLLELTLAIFYLNRP